MEELRNEQKPCGIPSELADVCIRIFDIAGKYEWGERLQTACDYTEPSWSVNKNQPFADNLAVIHLNLVDSFRSVKGMKVFGLADAVINTRLLSEFYSIDLNKAITEKMAYNATRPQSHGGKVL